MLWSRTSRSHDISGPVEQVSVLVVLDGGACPGALHAPRPHPSWGRCEEGSCRTRCHRTAPHRTAPDAPHAPRHMPRRARHETAKTRVVLYPTIRQWNGCPSDKRQLVWCVVHAVRGQTGGRCGGGSERPSRTPRPFAAAGRGPGRDFREGSDAHLPLQPTHTHSLSYILKDKCPPEHPFNCFKITIVY